jgi:precorrin-6A/cobalt-precorrin-6A reductase
MLAGTGEGPLLAAKLLEHGWALRVSVVSAAAGRPYRALQAAAPLELQVGPLVGTAAMAAQLQQAVWQGEPFVAVIDATHPFATEVSRCLRQACLQQRQLLLTLAREPLAPFGATLLAQLADLRTLDLRGARLLLAIGARHLAQAVACSPGALHHARVLPSASALQLVSAAGLHAERIACLRPAGQEFAVEAALVRRWRIDAILCRQSGGLTEAGWRQVALRQGCRLLMLARPPLDLDPPPLSIQGLLARLESLDPALVASHDDGSPRTSGGDPGPHH